MGKAIRASVLVLVLACSAQAGHIHNDAKPPTPAPTQEVTADGYVQNDLTETVLSLLASMLTLF
jgi:hypothetical protein